MILDEQLTRQYVIQKMTSMPIEIGAIGIDEF
jgi:hypothetical protein